MYLIQLHVPLSTGVELSKPSTKKLVELVGLNNCVGVCACGSVDVGVGALKSKLPSKSKRSLLFTTDVELAGGFLFDTVGAIPISVVPSKSRSALYKLRKDYNI